MSWVKLNMKCPHCGKGNQTYWTHTGCGSYLYINKDARVECSNSPTHGYPFTCMLQIYIIYPDYVMKCYECYDNIYMLCNQ